jgi:recombinational DNA repair ATPase RecF
LEHFESQVTPFLKHLKIEAFRGVNEPCDLDLNASAVVVSGANGRGKTSLTDAVQWLLLGSLPRLTPLRNKRNEEHIVNRYAEESKKLATVEAIFSPSPN